MRYRLTAKYPGPFKFELPAIPGALHRAIKGSPTAPFLALTVTVHHTDVKPVTAWIEQHGGTEIVKHRRQKDARARVNALLGLSEAVVINAPGVRLHIQEMEVVSEGYEGGDQGDES